MDQSTLKPAQGSKHPKKRIGRGHGSGQGAQAGRGHKGAQSRSGYSFKRGFEGGQMPLHRRLPKRGFTNIFKKQFALVNLGRLDKLEGDTFTPDSLQATGTIHKLHDGLKVLATGQLSRAINVEAHHFSKAAIEKIQAAGGKATLIGAKSA